MNDQELDHILEAWTLTPPSPSLRGRVRAQYRDKPPRRFPFGGLAIAAAVFLISILAFSQTSKIMSGFAGVTFTVDIERTFYKDGTVTHTLETCYQFGGMLMRVAKMPCFSKSRNLIDAVEFITLEIAPSVLLRPKTPREAADSQSYIRAGCIQSGETVMGYESVAGYPTVKILSDASPAGRRRVTVWDAPDLGCFPLRMTIEEASPGGKIQLRQHYDALAVHKR
jgi:hypothetical protein